MATHDYDIANQSGASFRTDLNNALAAIQSNNSNSSSPATTVAYQWWADTTNGVLKIRNSSNNDWVELLQLDGTLTLEDGSASTPGLAFRDDLNTGIFSSAADTFNVATAGVERMELGATTIFNEDGADVDFRIEGDTEVNLFYVDAGNNRIGIGTNSPDVPLTTVFTNNNSSSFTTGAALASGANANLYALHLQNTGTGNSESSLLFSTGDTQFAQWSLNCIKTGAFVGDLAFRTRSGSATSAERMRLNSAGILLAGSTTNASSAAIQGFKAHGSTGNESGFTSIDTTSMAAGVGGEISFMGKTTSSGDYNYLGHIRGIKSNASSGDTACELTFHTRPSLTAPQERMRINQEGLVLINEAKDGMSLGFGQQQLSVKAGTFSPALFESTGATLSTMLLTNSSTSAAVNMVDMRCARDGNSAFTFFIMRSGASSSSSGDTEIKFVGDGNAFADGSFTGGGADYAEYFEWADGNSSDEDRRGYTVVLDGNKIRKSTSSDAATTIIGVVSGNPSVVGDGDIDKWKQKYQKDDYGTYIRDENGDKILNSEFDETKTYISRAERKEWDIIGLMGKIRIRKGQTMGTNWIKMQDISDTVEEWLVK